ncbi:non-ribosomal peptide synthetase [Caldalkalibacillus mannanilyticus]|uniref:non-ribosomal peptide synthetase n=1 Tax=Caldalkalibacillus mannanilyticus TaxID=1418 RepID=UPI001F3AB92E|nr:non-ribosomal peptide synthetase [Caldalkalibacillus mannanilyticus]
MYNAYVTKREPDLPALEVDYVDYAEWMNRLLEEGYLEEQRQYWLKRFVDVPSGLYLPTDYPRPPVVTFNGGTVLARFHPDLQKQVYDFCQKNDLTLYMFLLAVLNLYMYRLSGQNDFVLGSPILNRDDVKLENMLGLFATAIPLRCTVEKNMTFEQLLALSKQSALDAYDNHLYPSNFVVEQINTQTDLSRSKLFSVMYGLQNNKQSLVNSLTFEGLSCTFKIFDFIESSSRFDLTFAFDELENGIEINLNYNSDLFKQSTAERMASQFILLTQQVVSEPEHKLSTYSLVTPEEQRIMLEDWNQTDRSYHEHICIHEWIELQTEKQPDQTAVCYEEKTLSYRHLNEKANKLAHFLKVQGVEAKQKVGIMLETSVDMLVSILAVMKAGAAYVPLSPEIPSARRKKMLEKADIQLIITKGSVAAEEAFHSGSIINLDEEGPTIDQQPSRNLQTSITSRDVAYVMFTSGTTGVPKGIEIEHRGVINLLEWSQEKYPLTADDATLFMTLYTFDASILEMIWPLTVGARIVIPKSHELKNPVTIGQLAYKHQVTILQFVPLLLEAFVQARKNNEFPELPSLRYVICGGAQLTKDLLEKFQRQFTCGLYNHYGPTEITVDAITFDCQKEFEGNVVPIGRPIANTKVYLLDEDRQMVSIGVPGEIYIASHGQARGYVNDEEATKQSFVPNPFSDDPHSYIYRTGDVAKYSEDGHLIYIGRVDHQVKVRGNRVELEEVENWLSSHESISRCAVIHQKTEQMDSLIAYVQLHDELTSNRGSQEKLKLRTLSQSPSLKRRMDELHLRAWPSYFAGEEIQGEYWPKLFQQFPEYQFGVINNEGTVLGVGNSLPIYWDGTVEDLPHGWDDGLVQGFSQEVNKQEPNTLLILAGVVDEEFQGQGLAGVLVQAFKELAHGHGLERVIVPVRPTGKANYPDLDFVTYCELRREDQLPVDHWLRSHIRVGGKILRVETKSQYVKGSVTEWQSWTGIQFKQSGFYEVPDALQPVQINIEENLGEYWDPSVWIEHPLTSDTAYGWKYADGGMLQSFLKQYMPEYMVPQQYIFITDMPLTTSGKIDKKSVVEWGAEAATEREFVLPQSKTEEEILVIWKEILQNDQISMIDNFFDLGGHSLKATQVVTRMSKVFGISFDLRELFQAVTIRSLAEVVEKKVTSQSNRITGFQKVERRPKRKK